MDYETRNFWNEEMIFEPIYGIDAINPIGLVKTNQINPDKIEKEKSISDIFQYPFL